jgi:hypothetical protein
MPSKHTPESTRKEFERAVGRRRRITVRGYGPHVQVIETGEFVTRAVFLWWKRYGWLREESFAQQRAVYERVDEALELSA